MNIPEHGRAGAGAGTGNGYRPHPAGSRFESFVDAAVTRAETTLSFDDPMVLRLSLMLRKVNHLMTDDANRQVHQAEGWTQASFRVCFGLWVAGPMPPHQIAATTNMSRASVSAALKKIEEDGLVSREPSPIDQRSTVLRLTQAGEQAVIRTYESHIALEHHWLEPLNETERLMLFLLLRKLLAGPAATEGRS